MKKIILISLALCAASLSNGSAQTGTDAATAASQQAAGQWARQAIELMVQKGLIVGYPGGQFNWAAPATRQEVAVMLARLLSQYPPDKLETLLSPAEMEVLIQGVSESRAALSDLQTQVQTLLDTVATLQTQVGDLQGAAQANAALGDASAALSARLDELEATANQGLETSQAAQGNTDMLSGQVETLQSTQADQARLLTEAQGTLTQLSSQLQQDNSALSAQVTALQASLDKLSTQLQAQQQQNSGLQAQMSALDTRLKAQEEASAQRQRDEMRLKSEVSARARWYVGAGGHLVGTPSGGTQLRLIAGNDALIGNFGLRLSGDMAVGGQGLGSGVALLGTYRTSSGPLDGYVGVGVGRNFTRNQTFGDITIGANYRLTRQLALFTEARQTFSFGLNEHFGSLTFGVQYRF